MAKINLPSTVNRQSVSHRIAPEADRDLAALPRDEKIKILRYALSWFNPPHDRKKSKTYTKTWWDKLTYNQKTVVWLLLLPERSDPEYKDMKTLTHVEFYSVVTEENAMGWYGSLPEHLRRQVDQELAKRGGGKDAPRDETYEYVFGIWGDRPELPDKSEDGLSLEDEYRMEVWREWVRCYDERLLITVVMQLAKRMQEERKMLSSALGLDVSLASLPCQSVGLDDTQAATVRWLQNSGQTPLEYLADTYRSEDPTVKVGDKITAARALLDYVHRKVPQKTEIESKDITEPKLDRSLLKKLSNKDLATLEELLGKLGKE